MNSKKYYEKIIVMIETYIQPEKLYRQYDIKREIQTKSSKDVSIALRMMRSTNRIRSQKFGVQYIYWK